MTLLSLSGKGQALIETLLTLPIAAALLATIIALSYRAALFSYADFQLHEALLCTDDSTPDICKVKLRSRLCKMLFFQESLEVQIFKQNKKATGTIHIHKMHVSNLYYKFWPDLRIEKEINFPLNPR
ncbi:MAG: hypothetical protein ACM3MG_07185 [Bacillota bacterium]